MSNQKVSNSDLEKLKKNTKINSGDEEDLDKNQNIDLEPQETKENEVPEVNNSKNEDPYTDVEVKLLQDHIASLESELRVAKLETDDWKIRTSRLAADLQNMSKQLELDIIQAKKSSKKNSILTTLDFLNTLNLAFLYLPQTEDESILKFFNTLKFSFTKLIEDLKSVGIEIIIPATGEVFNPEYMSILNPEKAQEYENSDILVDKVVSCGLKIDDQVVRPSNILI